MIAAIVLGVLGLILIYFEFFLPGGIMGIAGAILMILGLVILIVKEASPVLILIYFVMMSILLAIAIKMAIIKVKKTKGSFYLEDDQQGFLASRFEKDLIGKQGVAASDLKPSGHVTIEDQFYQAVSKTRYINKGSKVKVIGGSGGHIIVKQINEE